MNVKYLASRALDARNRGTPLEFTNTRSISDSVDARRPRTSVSSFLGNVRTAVFTVAQIAVLWFVSLGASTAAAWFHLPIPGNVLGLTLLFALLCSRKVKASWLEPAATLLVKHLAFFFIPITIGLMDMGRLFAHHGVGILVTLAISAAVGFVICGVTSQCLINAQNAYNFK